MSELEQILTIVGLGLITLLTRGFFLLPRRELPMPGWLHRGLKYAPLAALAAVIAPELVMKQGELIDTLLDARLPAIAVALVWFYLRGRGVLGTILVGMAVYLPLHIGLGW
ncbi:AzlD domain-containing protein [Caldimonas tepidiphila]|uniref:AzlD domain-containing protein n=1 Tax=Caldimonas tepidiphila TaxID=2315841 RepID=UPI000E5C08DD|nr:AzlD domain-containing protein [Caldimonas tepidiphila]